MFAHEIDGVFAIRHRTQLETALFEMQDVRTEQLHLVIHPEYMSLLFRHTGNPRQYVMGIDSNIKITKHRRGKQGRNG